MNGGKQGARSDHIRLGHGPEPRVKAVRSVIWLDAPPGILALEPEDAMRLDS